MSGRSRSTGGSRFGAAAIALLVLSAAPVAAQGNGHGHAYGLANKNVSSSAPSAAGAQEFSASGLGYRNFGSWLDDATVMPEGNGFVSLAFSYWRTPTFREIDLPVLDTGLSLNRRVQFGMSAPYYHAGEPGRPTVRGLGDLYLSTKIQLRDPAKRAAGFAVTPILEVLSAPLPDGGGRVSWGLPLSVEVQRKGWRAFGSAGYFSRGALFASGAVELAASDRVWFTGSISESHSLKRDDLSFALGLSKTRTDVSGGLAFTVRPSLAVFGSVGRTISKPDASSASLMFTTGMSLSFR
ncbi:MAG TPA: hypothetical protein VJ813_05795 [Vicinamibacterales bacterium]|nr:hypothetical protein [Vicinamibacterales bacterium]